MNVLNDISSSHGNVATCSCSTLTIDDIPGAKLTKSPEKSKKSELEFWLKCRGFKVKKSETKAKLCDRVRQALKIDISYKFVDLDPSQCHIQRKRSLCTQCVTVSTCIANANDTSVKYSECVQFNFKLFIYATLNKV